MSGWKKRLIYYICDLLLYVAWIAAALVMFLYTTPRPPKAAEYFALSFFLLAELFNLPALVHEAGHLLFGLLSGMKLAGFHFSPISRNTAGATEMFPKCATHVRRKYFLFALGGAALNLLAGGAFLALYFCLPYHPALFFLGLLAPLMLCEGIRALIPAELPAGKTDGMVLLGIIKNSSEEEIALRVLEAQGVLYKNTFDKIKKERLYEVPIVREDLPAFSALLFLRLGYELYTDSPEAVKTLSRLEELDNYFSPAQREALNSFKRAMEGEPDTKKEPLLGMRDLKCRLAAKCKKED